MLVVRKFIVFTEKQSKVACRFVALANCNKDVKKYNSRFLSGTAKNDPPMPPRRPLTAYLVFCKENRNIVLKENPSLSATEQTKVLAERWKKLSAASREIYENTARDSVIVYAQAHKEYYENLTEEQREALMKLKARNKEARKNMRIKKMLKESGIPKASTSAYTLFVQDEAKGKNISSLPEFNKEVATSWRALSEEKKQIYANKAKKEKEIYEAEMKAWREKLKKGGQQSLLQAYDESKLKAKETTENPLTKIKK